MPAAASRPVMTSPLELEAGEPFQAIKTEAHASVPEAALAERVEDGLEDLLGDHVGRCRGEPGDRAVAPHAAGVRPLVAGEDALVVLCRRHGHAPRAATEGQ